MSFSKEPSFVEHASDGIITRIGLQLIAERDDHYDPAGTAVVIGTWLAMTAKHVIEDYWQNYESRPLKDGHSGSFRLQAIQILENGKKQQGVRYGIPKIVIAPWTDIALLQLVPWSDMPRDYKWLVPPLDLFPPPRGARTSAFGYRDSSVIIKDKHVTFQRGLATSVGEVIEIHDQRRDSQLCWPCFQTNARYDGGMSGGPVLTDEGYVCGLICKNMPPFAEGEEHVSYVTSLWPLMGLEVDFQREDRPPGTKYPMLDLAQAGLIDVRGWERIELQRSENGAITKVLAHPV